jgi:hypothetical protein
MHNAKSYTSENLEIVVVIVPFFISDVGAP